MSINRKDGVFFLCDILHGHNNGSGEYLPITERADIREKLREKLANWEEGKGTWKRYDDCVKALIEAVLKEDEI